MNILITGLICLRLYQLGKQAKSAIGVKNAEPYTNLAAILVESAAPYTIVGIILLPFYARGNNIALSIGQVWSKLTVSSLLHPGVSTFADCSVLQAIAPQLIILRILNGKAWDRDTITLMHSGTWPTQRGSETDILDESRVATLRANSFPEKGSLEHV